MDPNNAGKIKIEFNKMPIGYFISKGTCITFILIIGAHVVKKRMQIWSKNLNFREFKKAVGRIVHLVSMQKIEDMNLLMAKSAIPPDGNISLQDFAAAPPVLIMYDNDQLMKFRKNSILLIDVMTEDSKQFAMHPYGVINFKNGPSKTVTQNSTRQSPRTASPRERSPEDSSSREQSSIQPSSRTQSPIEDT